MPRENFIIEEGVLKKYVGTEKNVVIPEGVTSIGKDAFAKNCNKHWDCNDTMISVVIPDSVAEIGEGAFSTCISLESVVIPEGVSSIKDYTFSICSNLKSAIIPNSVTRIGKDAFSYSGLSRIVIANGVVEIGESAFAWCSSLESVVLPKSIREVDEQVFEGCDKLKSWAFVDPDKKTLRPSAPPFAKSYPYLSDKEFKVQILNKDSWGKLSTNDQAKLFSSRSAKSLQQAYAECTEDCEALGEAILSKFPRHKKPSVKECRIVARFMNTFSQRVSVELLFRMHEALVFARAKREILESDPIDRIVKKIADDDASVMGQLQLLALRQSDVLKLVEFANRKKASSCTAALLEFKNANFPDFDPMAEFTLE